MCAFRKRYTGQLWLEVLVAEGFNDTDAEVHALRSAIERIAPDRIHLNTVVRPPAYAAARPVPSRRLGEIAAMLGQKCSIACSSPADEAIGAPVPPEAIAAMLSRRPMTCGELAAALRLGLPQVDEALGRLIEEGRLFRVAHDGRVYYETPRESRGAG
jgi:wyosine [tRNA(Phe)-imidazoG37] synthetase (radical SAM superfamily)